MSQAPSASATTATRAKSEFVADTSHELRTPLTAILGFAELLREGGVPDELRREAVDAIVRNSEHLLRLLDDLLDLSKIEAGRLTVYPRRCALDDVVGDVAVAIGTAARGKGIALEIERFGDLPGTIATDPMRLRQILINLLGNAVKFTRAGSVRLRLRRCGQKQLEFAVIDTGIGIGPAQLARLFQRFAQGDEAIGRQYGGNGLGLSISRRLAELLGGTLEAESRLGEGSTFRLTLPIGNPAAKPEDDARPTPPAAMADRLPDNVRVLLAEDATDTQRLLKRVLELAGATVTVVNNGQEAIDEIDRATRGSQPFDVVLMDMEMPIVSGYDATQRLRASGYRGRIVALTAHAMQDDARRCREAGCDDYASKPIHRAALVELVARHAAAYSLTTSH